MREPGCICMSCGNKYSKHICEWSTFHTGTCCVCGDERSVTEYDDYGLSRERMLEILREQKMIDPIDLKNALAEYSGSEHFYKVSAFAPNFIITEGVKFLADEAQCYWLLDVIVSHLPAVIAADEEFAVVLLERDPEGSGAVFQITDDVPANVVYARQEIEFTTFPMPSIKLYLQTDTEHWTLMLPGEY